MEELRESLAQSYQTFKTESSANTNFFNVSISAASDAVQVARSNSVAGTGAGGSPQGRGPLVAPRVRRTGIKTNKREEELQVSPIFSHILFLIF